MTTDLDTVFLPCVGLSIAGSLFAFEKAKGLFGFDHWDDGDRPLPFNKGDLLTRFDIHSLPDLLRDHDLEFRAYCYGRTHVVSKASA